MRASNPCVTHAFHPSWAEPQVVKRRGGFSLLEVMVALSILAVGLLSVTTGQILAIKSSASSRSNTVAMSLATERVEELRLMTGTGVKALTTAPGYPNDPANPIDPDPGDGAAMQFQRRWLIAADTPEPGIITMTVEVDWINQLGNVKTARIQTLKVDD